MSLLDNLPHTARHDRLAYEQDELIGNREREETQVESVSCWVQNASMTEINEFQKRDKRVTHKVFFASDPGLRPGDRLTITGGPSFVGLSFKFQADSDRSAGLGVLYAAMVEEERNLRHATFANA